MRTPSVPPADRGVPTPDPGRATRASDDVEPDPTGIRALLSALPDPGPMPSDLVARITASIAQEQSARSGGPRTGTEDGAVVPLRRRRWGWQHLGAAAAAAVILAVGLPALLTGTGPGGVLASLQGGSSADSASGARAGDSRALSSQSGGAQTTEGSPTPGPSAPGGKRVRGSVGDVTLTATGTAYTRDRLATQAALLGSTFAASPAAKDPAVPAGEAGLRACLTALGVPAGLAVRADVATLDGVPAVVALVGSSTSQSVYAVSPACSAEQPTLLAGPVPLP